MVNWAIAISNGLKEVSKCMIQYTHLPQKSAETVANVLHLFLTSLKKSRAKCAENCLALIKGKTSRKYEMSI